MATQHADLIEASWERLGLDRQILTLAAEMYRGRGRLKVGDTAEVRRVYERVLNLVDLTVAVNTSRGLRRELLRWRELVAGLYVAAAIDPGEHDAALGFLFTFSPAAFEQRAYLMPELPAPRPPDGSDASGMKSS